MKGIKKVQWKIPGFKEVRSSPGVSADLAARAARIAAACGAGYEPSIFPGLTRARASVITASAAARRDNARNNTLIRNLNAGG